MAELPPSLLATKPPGNYAVVDRRSKTVVMFSRIYDKHSKTLCKEEAHPYGRDL